MPAGVVDSPASETHMITGATADVQYAFYQFSIRELAGRFGRCDPV